MTVKVGLILLWDAGDTEIRDGFRTDTRCPVEMVLAHLGCCSAASRSPECDIATVSKVGILGKWICYLVRLIQT